MKLKYALGNEICEGDLVEYFCKVGQIEFVVDPDQPNAETDWFIKEFGHGVMVNEPKVFGSVFITNTEYESELVFVARKNAV